MAEEKGVQGGEGEFEEKKKKKLIKFVHSLCVCVCVCAILRFHSFHARSQARFSSSRLKLRIASSS